MKKFISILLVAIGTFFAINVNAQAPTLMPLIAGDTVVNTATVNKVFTASAGYRDIGVQAVITKISGTAGGTATFQGSLDNTNWENIGSAYTITDVASQAKAFTQTGNPYHYYRVKFTGTGTMSVQVRVYYVLRKTSIN